MICSSSRKMMARSRGRALFLSLVTGTLSALGMAVFLAILYAVTGLWLAGHNSTRWGWDGAHVTGLDWPQLLFTCGTILTWFTTTLLCYRAWRPHGGQRDEHQST